MKTSLKFIGLTFLSVSASMALAQGNKAEHAKGVQDLVKASNGKAQVSVDKQTGQARFVRLPKENELAKANGDASPQSRAMGFLRSHGNAFGVSDANAELKAVGTKRDVHGNQHSTFKQTYKGLPVFGAEIRAHFDKNGEMYVVNGNFVSKISVNTNPSLSADEAAGRAMRTVARQQAESAIAGASVGANTVDTDAILADLRTVDAKLMVFRAGLVQGVPGRDHLAYEVEVNNADITVREFVYVDAHTGKMIDQITGIHDALSRRAYDGENLPFVPPSYPGSPFWVEGDAFPTSEVEADNMILASAETYDLFFNGFGLDSFDGGGAIMDSIFNRGYSCPNASWNGVFISFCPGFTTDDITGHEWGHAYTQYSNNLIYAWQSGALNESYSDIWGETVDLINGRGLDVPGGPRTDGSCSALDVGVGDNSYRWLEGEESSIGALRDMWTPTCHGDPGKVTDNEYYCLSGDNGGVHFNSGVPNHAYALMVDGGNYNGYSGAGLGITKSAHIQFAASNLLSAASNFADNADALEAACASLTGVNLNDLLTGAPSGEIIDASDCDQVAAIIDAVEFRTPPDCGFVTLLDHDAPALCEGLGSVQTNFMEDFEGGSLPAGWTAGSHDVVDPGTFDSPGWSVETGLPFGNGSLYSAFAPDLPVGDCGADTEAGAVNLDSPVIVLPAGEVPHVAFDHYVATEAVWDGGNLKVSVNGGPWTVVPGESYTFNAYNSELVVSDNPLGGEEAFTGTDGGSNSGSWGQSQVNLYGVAFPGDSVQLRYDLGTDGCGGVVGWYVDNVHAYSCSEEELPYCGDGLLAPGESCDDGNSDDGDGCSSICQVEDGWLCADPTPSNPDGTNVVADWSFEDSFSNGDWTPFSTFGGAPGFPLCGPGNDCPAASLAQTGSWLVWIGGIGSGVTSTVEQVVTIPAAATELTLYTWRGRCDDASDTLHVQIDGNDVATLACNTTDGGFNQQVIPVAPYNDGGSHTLLIGGTVGGTNGTHTNFFVEDVVLNDNTPTEAMPSVCREIVYNLACNAGMVEFDDGISDSWTVVDNAGTGLVWTDIANSEIGGNWTGGTGDAASLSSDAFIFVDYDSELISNPFSLQNQASAALDYLVNYQNLVSGRDFLDVDITTDGGSNWTNLLSWSEDHGGFFSTPGEAVSIDLAAYLGEPEVQVRWHFYNPNSPDWDWYAQVDNVALTAPDDEDCDGVVDSVDACPGTMIPETTPANGLGKNRWVLLDGDTIFDTNGDQSPAYTLQDTAGCSCEQIIEGLGLGDGHAKFGCSNSNMKAWIEMVNQ